jgi:hypothetical protein
MQEQVVSEDEEGKEAVMSYQADMYTAWKNGSKNVCPSNAGDQMIFSREFRGDRRADLSSSDSVAQQQLRDAGIEPGSGNEDEYQEWYQPLIRAARQHAPRVEFRIQRDYNGRKSGFHAVFLSGDPDNFVEVLFRGAVEQPEVYELGFFESFDSRLMNCGNQRGAVYCHPDFDEIRRVIKILRAKYPGLIITAQPQWLRSIPTWKFCGHDLTGIPGGDKPLTEFEKLSLMGEVQLVPREDQRLSEQQVQKMMGGGINWTLPFMNLVKDCRIIRIRAA